MFLVGQLILLGGVLPVIGVVSSNLSARLGLPVPAERRSGLIAARYVACPMTVFRISVPNSAMLRHRNIVTEGTVTTAMLTEADTRVRDAVMAQLDWDPEVDASAVGAAARNGTVTLTGFIDTYSGKLAAERAAKRVHGVRGVANDIEVRLRLERTDADIAQDAVRALELRSTSRSASRRSCTTPTSRSPAKWTGFIRRRARKRPSGTFAEYATC